MTKYAALALYHRNGLSSGNFRQIFGHEAYHWAIIIMSEVSVGRKCHAFGATDKSDIDPVTFRMRNSSMDWWFSHRYDVELEMSDKFLGRIIIGKVPDKMSGVEFMEFFQKVPLSVKNRNPQQSCVSWAADAIRALQGQGWVSAFDLDQFKDFALSYADERMKGEYSTEPDLKHYGNWM